MSWLLYPSSRLSVHRDHAKCTSRACRDLAAVTPVVVAVPFDSAADSKNEHRERGSRVSFRGWWLFERSYRIRDDERGEGGIESSRCPWLRSLLLLSFSPSSQHDSTGPFRSVYSFFRFCSLATVARSAIFFAKMKLIQRHRRAILAPVSIVILLCGCTDLVSSRSPRFAEHPENDTDFVSTDCERVKPFFLSKNITIVIAKQGAAEDIAKSKWYILFLCNYLLKYCLSSYLFLRFSNILVLLYSVEIL